MKTIFLLLALAPLTFAQATSEDCTRRGLSMRPEPQPKRIVPPIDYPVSKIPVNDPRLAQILKSVNEWRHANIDATSLTLITIQQTLGDGRFLASYKLSGDLFCFLSPGGKYADGTSFACALEKQAGLFSYVDVRGANRTLNVFGIKPSANDGPMTEDAFIARLKAGEVFTIEKGVAVVTCKDCNGFGRIADTSQSGRSNDGKVECKACHGLGKFTDPQPYTVKW